MFLGEEILMNEAESIVEKMLSPAKKSFAETEISWGNNSLGSGRASIPATA